MEGLEIEKWTVRDAKSRLSELLRYAREKGPQVIGSRDQCVVISMEVWESFTQPHQTLGQWLVAKSPLVEFDLPIRGNSEGIREIPFSD